MVNFSLLMAARTSDSEHWPREKAWVEELSEGMLYVDGLGSKTVLKKEANSSEMV